MKRLSMITVIAGAMFLFAFSPAAAQKNDSAIFRRADGRPVSIETVDRDSVGIDTLRRIDAVESDLVRLRDGGRDGNVVLEVAGFGLTLGRTPLQEMAIRRPRTWFNIFDHLEFGFTKLTGMDYAGYAPGDKGFLEQQLGPSFHFSFNVIQFCVALNRSRTLSLGIGLQYTLDNYRLANSGITLRNESGRIVPVTLDEPADKSKVVTSSLGIPLRLMYNPVRRVEISVALHNDFTLGADAIRKKPKKKHGLSGLRDYQFGVGASVTYYGAGLFARYGVTPVFKTGAGPECRAFSFGFTYSMHF